MHTTLLWKVRSRLAVRARARRLRRALVERLWPPLGIPIRIEAPDRDELEQRILPWLAGQEGLEDVLFVGVGPYTKHYERMFRHRRYWTIDVDPARRRFGAGRRHIVGSVVDLDRHFASGTLDAAVVNGVLDSG